MGLGCGSSVSVDTPAGNSGSHGAGQTSRVTCVRPFVPLPYSTLPQWAHPLSLSCSAITWVGGFPRSLCYPKFVSVYMGHFGVSLNHDFQRPLVVHTVTVCWLCECDFQRPWRFAPSQCVPVVCRTVPLCAGCTVSSVPGWSLRLRVPAVRFPASLAVRVPADCEQGGRRRLARCHRRDAPSAATPGPAHTAAGGRATHTCD